MGYHSAIMKNISELEKRVNKVVIRKSAFEKDKEKKKDKKISNIN